MKQKEIITARLRLAALRPQDRDDLIGMLTDKDISATYMVPDLCSEEQKDGLFERFRQLTLSGRRFAYGIFSDGRLCGMIHEVDAEGGAIELGYFIGSAEKGKGYATEALGAAISALLDGGFDTVRAAAFEENAASMRVMEKCGMTRSKDTEIISYRGNEHVCIFYAINKK